MARQITGQIAKQIAKKLKAKKRKKSGSHCDYYDVWEDGEVKVWFTIRRSSERDKGNDHVQGQLKINTHRAKCLAQCSYTRKAYLEDLAEMEQ